MVLCSKPSSLATLVASYQLIRFITVWRSTNLGPWRSSSAIPCDQLEQDVTRVRKTPQLHAQEPRHRGQRHPLLRRRPARWGGTSCWHTACPGPNSRAPTGQNFPFVHWLSWYLKLLDKTDQLNIENLFQLTLPFDHVRIMLRVMLTWQNKIINRHK